MLNEPAESVEELAAEVIIAIDELRATRKDYVVVVYDPGVAVHIHGPYITKNAAQRDIGKNVYAASEGAKYGIFQLITDVEGGIEGVD